MTLLIVVNIVRFLLDDRNSMRHISDKYSCQSKARTQIFDANRNTLKLDLSHLPNKPDKHLKQISWEM